MIVTQTTEVRTDLASKIGTDDEIIIDIRGFKDYEQKIEEIKSATDFIFKNIPDPHQRLVLV